MEKIFIIKGVEETDSNPANAIVSKFGVKTNMESAKRELQEVIKEIKQDIEENGNTIIKERIYDTEFYIELDNGDTFDYEIIEREITE